VVACWHNFVEDCRVVCAQFGQPLFAPVWTGVRLYFTTSFHTYIARSEVNVRLPLFTPVLIGVRQRSFEVGASVGVQFGSHVSISDACGG
jgi:hypothetical protein